ncbi:Protein CBG15416 [Caenorhabditis briggsae]|uniref:Histone deacetylase n=2 Tax=Caenorhabditis briggsae TaxID=6238 RepID=A8XMB6_CAEBR|nr:Protein CBG15416 [Caenorhabditis briggsae]CAP33791.1 Protein CBG15416 [Caenorhabditis briggsae]
MSYNVREHSSKKIAYYYDSNIGNFHFGPEHPMKPNRIRLAHQLVTAYGLYRHMDIFRPFPATRKDMQEFHPEDYTYFLSVAEPQRVEWLAKDMKKYNIGEDCPIISDLFQYNQTTCGGTLAAATKLNKQKADIVINWMGGSSHAKYAEANGFCFTNDVVLGILKLLDFHPRVLYVDIDVLHGDGVEEAFYCTDRVMTVSFHQYGKGVFPGTGNVQSIGAEEGTGYSVNVPLKEGITDKVYQSIFKPIITKVMDRFDPSVIVLQCGPDSLSGDKIGRFNLTLDGHGECVSFLRSFNLPLMLLGGGGFNSDNVAKCWANETAIACGQNLPVRPPGNDYKKYFRSSFRLPVKPSNMANHNRPKELAAIQREIFANLNSLPAVPSVQMQPIQEEILAPLPEVSQVLEMANPDERLPPQVMDSVVAHEGEFYDFENGSGANRGVVQYADMTPPDDWFLDDFFQDLQTIEMRSEMV